MKDVCSGFGLQKGGFWQAFSHYLAASPPTRGPAARRRIHHWRSLAPEGISGSERLPKKNFSGRPERKCPRVVHSSSNGAIELGCVSKTHHHLTAAASIFSLKGSSTVIGRNWRRRAEGLALEQVQNNAIIYRYHYVQLLLL